MSLLAEFVKKAALEEGFSLAGISPAAPLGELDYFPGWIEAGYHGEMEYLAKTNDAGELRRAALANVAPWARSVVVCAANYNSDVPYSTQCADPGRGWISRYAFVEATITSCCWDVFAASNSAWWSASWNTDRPSRAARAPGVMSTPARWWSACWQRTRALDGRARTAAFSISSLARGFFSE